MNETKKTITIRDKNRQRQKQRQQKQQQGEPKRNQETDKISYEKKRNVISNHRHIQTKIF